jgi:hypothetical protein
LIAWTCRGRWHLHLSEHLHRPHGEVVWLNPLRPGGKLGPVADTARPVIRGFRIYRGERRIFGATIAGTVNVTANALDRFSPQADEWPGAPEAGLHVYRAEVELRRSSHGRLLQKRRLFRLDTVPRPRRHHYTKGPTHRNVTVHDCAERLVAPCDPALWIRLWPTGWNTRRVANGVYDIRLVVYDTAGNSASRSLRVRVRN